MFTTIVTGEEFQLNVAAFLLRTICLVDIKWDGLSFFMNLNFIALSLYLWAYWVQCGWAVGLLWAERKFYEILSHYFLVVTVKKRCKFFSPKEVQNTFFMVSFITRLYSFISKLCHLIINSCILFYDIIISFFFLLYTV